MERKKCRTRFSCASTAPASTGGLRISGSIPELGNWDITKGIPLYPNPGASFEFSSEELELPACAFEFKLIREDKDLPLWEALPDYKNHTADLSGHSYAQIMVREGEERVDLTHNHKRNKSIDMEELTKFTRTVRLSGSESVIVASMHLPLAPVKLSDGKWSLQMSNQPLYPVIHNILSKGFKKARWVGFCDLPKTATEADKNEIELLLNKRRCYPIFLDPAVKAKFFKYYESILYPFFHNFVEPTENFGMLRPEYWENYVYVNKLFADTILAHAKLESLIWINDMHLLMCPLQIALRNAYTNMGIYLHSSFPSAELYKVFPHRQPLLQSILCCNVVGFHVFTYARHFLVACRRILGLEHHMYNGYIYVESGNRKVMIKVQHCGIDMNFMKEMLKSEEFTKEYEKVQEICKGKYVLGSVDRLSPLSGVAEKFAGYQTFLGKYAEFKESTILMQYMYELSLEGKQQEETKMEKDTYKEIVSKYGDEAIKMEKGKVTKELRWALMAVSDIWVITSLRQGYSLNALEYIGVRGLLGKKHGNVILSTFSGSIHSLTTSSIINPYDTNEIAKAIKDIIKDPIDRQQAKFNHDLMLTSKNTPSDWMKGWLCDIVRANNRTSKTVMMVLGIRENTRLLRLRNNFRFFDESLRSNMVKAYLKAQNRLILLDNEGTLGPVDPFRGTEFLEQLTILSEPVASLLSELCTDLHTSVCIISGRDSEHMMAKFGNIKNLGIAAENGYYYTWTNAETAPEYNKFMEVKDWGWKATVLEIFNSYMERIDGSFIVNRNSSIRWFYKDVDTDFGIKESNELVAHLHTILGNLPLDIVHGKTYVEVKPKGIGKGTFAKHLLEEIGGRKGEIDFILCIGDSETDEEMLGVMKEFPKTHALEKNTYCITVGQKMSVADYFVNDSQDVINTLLELVTPPIENEQVSFLEEHWENTFAYRLAYFNSETY